MNISFDMIQRLLLSYEVCYYEDQSFDTPDILVLHSSHRNISMDYYDDNKAFSDKSYHLKVFARVVYLLVLCEFDLHMFYNKFYHN